MLMSGILLPTSEPVRATDGQQHPKEIYTLPLWLDSVINFLNDNSGAITVITTVILVIITWRYVRLTKLMLKASNTPVVRIFLHASGFSITLCVENIGTGFAQDIKFKGDLSFKPTEPGEATIGELNPFKDGIDYLGPGHKSETFLFHRGELTQLPNHTFPITVTYKDLAGFKDEKTFTDFTVGTRITISADTLSRDIAVPTKFR